MAPLIISLRSAQAALLRAAAAAGLLPHRSIDLAHSDDTDRSTEPPAAAAERTDDRPVSPTTPASP